MRVLLLTLDLDGGGAARCVRELLENLPRYGVEAEAWVARAGRYSGPRVRVFQAGWERWLSPLEALPGFFDARHRGSIRALGTVARDRFDVVHMHVIYNGCASMRAVHDLCRQVPTVWTLHDEWAISGGLTVDLSGRLDPQDIVREMRGVRRLLAYSPYHDSFRRRDIQRLLRRWMPRPAEIVVPSEFIAGRARQSGRFPGIPIHVVRNCVPFQDLPEVVGSRSEARRLLRLPSESLVLLLVAPNLQHFHKGIEFGLRAIDKLKCNSLHVLLVGSGAEAVRSRLTCPSTSLMANDDAALARAYRAADATVVPSLGESFSLVAAESMACETPVVGFAVGGLAELIGDNERGRLATPYSVDDMATQVLRLLEYPEERRALGVAGRAWVRQECNPDHYFSSLIAIYERALAGESDVPAGRLTTEESK